MTIRCKESRRVDADRVCDLFTGLSPWKCLPCARNEPWPESPPAETDPTVVWQIPIQFISAASVMFHVERHHNQWLEPSMKLKQAVKEHAAMHGVEGPEWIPTWPAPIPHIHADVDSWSVIRPSLT